MLNPTSITNIKRLSKLFINYREVFTIELFEHGFLLKMAIVQNEISKLKDRMISMRLFLVLLGLIFMSLMKIQGQDTVLQYLDAQEVKFEEDFQSKYKSKEFQYKLPNKPKVVSNQNWGPWVNHLLSLSKYLLYLLLIVAVVIVVRELAQRIQKGDKNNDLSTNVKIISEDVELNFTDENLDKLILKNSNEGNYRMALRYHFIKVLKMMVSKNIVEWDPDKTNTDYRYEIQSLALSTKFSTVSRIYEYVWYGEFLLDMDQYLHAKSQFEDIYQDIESFKLTTR